jgi:membrane protein YdbS with pleckstrin-like domain
MSSKFDQNILPAFDSIKDDDETILWVGKPEYKPYMLLVALGALLPIGFGIITFFSALDTDILMPFFMSFGTIGVGVGMILWQHWGYSNVCYAYSNKRVLIRQGFIGTDFITLDYDKIIDVSVNVSIIERYFNVGTVRFFSGKTGSNKNGTYNVYDTWQCIENPYEVFKKVKQITTEMKKDVHYPNKLRPE